MVTRLRWIVQTALLITLSAVPASSADPLKGEIPTWSKSGVLSGYDAKPDECTKPEQIWVQDRNNGYCIRFFANFKKPYDKPPQAVVVYFIGDLIGFNWDANGWPASAKYETRIQGLKLYQSNLGILADAGKTPFVVIARPGTMGSSGDHKKKFRHSEARIMNLAIDALQKKFGLGKIVLAGHSGGALLAANLLSKRNDVTCAVMASGAVALHKFAVDSGFSSSTYATWEDPLASVDQVKDADQQLIVLTGKNDPRRPESYQKEYANALRARGLDAHYWVLQKSHDAHNTEHEAVRAAVDCAAGKSATSIRKRFKILEAAP